MPTTNQTQQFVQLLDESGLSDERKEFWVKKMDDPNFSEADRKTFIDEMTEHLSMLDTAVAMTEADIAQKETKIKELKTEALPYLQQVAKAQPAVLEAEAKEYKNAIHKAENEMLAELKTARSASNSQEIEAIRKKLGSN